jgi:hypothetical protein
MSNKKFELLVDYNDRFCFVEFNDKILIESEIICMDYFIHKLLLY